ncbi:ABC transporter permease [Gaopeijia maritima]|uniref:ABC transporter permease n=1 Tax=Gaopeijia maritima TaxID=3119007 RepID=A0ABU9E8H2_9BACT
MLTYLARRLLVALLLAFGVATVTFALVWFAPGDDRAELLLRGVDTGPTFEVEPPLLEAYGEWLGGLVRGDLGRSRTRGPVAERYLDVLPHTAALSLAGLALAILFGVGTGVLQAARRGSLTDRVLGITTAVFYAAPSFWVGILLAGVFVYLPIQSGRAPLLPLSGVAPAGGARGVLDFVPYLVLPALTLGLVLGAGIARFTRTSMLEVLEQDYVRAARARGIGESRVLARYGLRTALLPLISLLGVYLPLLLTGAVFVEVVFERIGVGRTMVDAIARQDLPMVVGGALLFGFATVAGNLVADLLYGWADPRIGDASGG